MELLIRFWHQIEIYNLIIQILTFFENLMSDWMSDGITINKIK